MTASGASLGLSVCDVIDYVRHQNEAPCSEPSSRANCCHIQWKLCFIPPLLSGQLANTASVVQSMIDFPIGFHVSATPLTRPLLRVTGTCFKPYCSPTVALPLQYDHDLSHTSTISTSPHNFFLYPIPLHTCRRCRWARLSNASLCVCPFEPTILSYCFKANHHIDWCNVNNITSTKRVTKLLSPNFWKSTHFNWVRQVLMLTCTDLQRINKRLTVR